MQLALLLVILSFLVFELFIFSKMKLLLSPASVFTLFTLFLLFFSIVFENGENGYLGYLWLIFAILIVNLGTMLSTSICPKGRAKSKFHINKSIVSNVLLIGVILLSFIAVINYIRYGGVSNAANNAYNYYTSEAVSMTIIDSLFNQLISISYMLVSFVGGIYLVIEDNKKKRLLSYLVFVYPVVTMLYSTQKLDIILTFFYFVIGIIVASIYSNKSLKPSHIFILIKKYWKFALLLIGVFILSFMLRWGRVSFDVLFESIHKLNTYAFGGFQCFNAWFSSYSSNLHTFGLQSFMGIPHAFGYVDRVSGLYQESYVTALGSTNIYTAFRPLIEDFGFTGSIVFLFIVGFISGISFKEFARYKTNRSLFIILVVYLYFIYSSITSPYIYLNVSLSFIVLILIVRFYRFLIPNRDFAHNNNISYKEDIV